MISRYNKLTETEFILLKGTDKIATMLSNKFVVTDYDVVHYLEQHAMGQFCVVVNERSKSWIIYFEQLSDVLYAEQYFAPKQQEAPPIHTINIVNE
jgi:hypothetical protein